MDKTKPLFYNPGMKRFAFAAVVFLAACQFQPSAGTVGEEKVYPRSEIETAYGIPEDVVVYIYLPPGYDAGAAGGYAAAFVLDGDSHFETAVREYESFYEEGKTDPILIFGIGYGYPGGAYSGGGRFRDYPTPDSVDLFTGELLPKEKTNCDNFLKLIKERIVPDAEKAYRIDAGRKALLGHSLGGGLTFYAFQTYNRTATDSLTENPFSIYCYADGGTSYGDMKRIGAITASAGTRFDESESRSLTLYAVYGYSVNPPSVMITESMLYSLLEKNYSDLEIHRFYPRNDNHAATMTTYLRNSLKLISNDRNGFRDFEDPDCVRPQTGDEQ